MTRVCKKLKKFNNKNKNKNNPLLKMGRWIDISQNKKYISPTNIWKMLRIITRQENANQTYKENHLIQIRMAIIKKSTKTKTNEQQ